MLLFNFISSEIMCTLVVHQTLVKSDIQSANSNLCRSQLKFGSETVLYCEKAVLLASVTQQAQFSHSTNQPIHFSLFTEKVQDYFVDFTMTPENLPSFALLGITSSVDIRTSNISVQVPYYLAEGALICFSCDATTESSNFTFISKGQNISGFVLNGNNYLTIQNSLFQFRLKGSSVGGLVQRGKVNLQLLSCNLTAYLEGTVIGTLVGVVSEQTHIKFADTNICSNAANIGSGEGLAVIDGVFSVKCDICGNQLYTYGICQTMLEFGEIVDQKLVCKSTFVFNEQCTCPEGQVVNQSSCVSILDVVNAVIKSQEVYLDQTTQLDLRIFNNVSVLNNSIINNVSAINSTLENIASTLSAQQTTNTDFTQRVATLSQDIQNFIDKVICESSYGYQFVNKQCVYVTCPITGQQSINGVCQCLPINAVASNNVCVCPANSVVINNACVCSITGQMFIGGVCQCITPGAVESNGQCTCGIDGLNISNSCSCPPNSQLVNNQLVPATCTCNIAGQVIVSGQCLCPSGYSLINGSCMYTIINIDLTMTCSQPVFFTIFDIQTITHSITSSSNFTTGWVFNTGPEIQGAFIDISNSVYSTTVKPLFQSQSSFSNIKVQIGTQTLGSGPILTASINTIINNMCIISKTATTITVSTSQQLSILQTSSTVSTTINNLILNLLFASSSGNITLIKSISQKLSITGYQIVGKYQTTLFIAMVGLEISSATLQLNSVHFKPTMFTFGNCSSYLISFVVSSQMTLTGIFVQFGTQAQFLTTVSVTSTVSAKFYFGGLVMNISASSTFTVNSLILDCYQKLVTDQIQSSGFLIGISNAITSNILIQNICLQQNLTSTSTYIEQFGLVGNNSAQISIQQSIVTLTVQGTTIYRFGIIGFSQSLVTKQIINLQATVRMQVISGQSNNYNSILFGKIDGSTCLIQNNTLINCNISTYSSGGGVFGGISSVNFTLQDLKISYFNFSSIAYTGCILGLYEVDYSVFTIQNSTFSNTNITGDAYAGGLMGAYGAVDSKLMVLNTTLLTCNLTASYVGVLIGVSADGLVQFKNSTINSISIYGSTPKMLFAVIQNTKTFDISTSCSIGVNTFKKGTAAAVVQGNCASFLSYTSDTGC
ncbi:Conserved_hypothetical protein [Hexamita inflata]|uniref:Uncharacterized protein n=1 Tax=Hexamita inflata TaxID=28002 RepID=A0AA86TNQ8_9EUKA|nr:Conserved hypothetical protein [Hexamita inflata]